MKKIIQILLVILGLAFLCYGMLVLFVIGPGNWFNFVWLIIGGFIIAFAFLLNLLLKKCKILVIILVALAAIFIGILTTFFVKEIDMANSTSAQNGDWIVVLGARVKEGSVSLEFAKRLDGCIEYANKNPRCKILTTGGQGRDEPCAEGDYAKAYLEKRGIESSRIYVENKSTSTSENLKFGKEIIEKAGGKLSDSIVIVTSKFHIFRTSLIAEKYGYTNCSYFGTEGLAILIPHYYFREFAAFVREFVL